MSRSLFAGMTVRKAALSGVASRKPIARVRRETAADAPDAMARKRLPRSVFGRVAAVS